jgi:hypothetical protein
VNPLETDDRKRHRDVFVCVMPFYGEAMHMRNMEMSFFVVCPWPRPGL